MTHYVNVIESAPNADIENPGTLASRLWLARQAARLTQEELGELAGIHQTTISHYETGRREPDLTSLRSLVWALGCGADYLLATRPKADDVYRAKATIVQADTQPHIREVSP